MNNALLTHYYIFLSISFYTESNILPFVVNMLDRITK